MKNPYKIGSIVQRPPIGKTASLIGIVVSSTKDEVQIRWLSKRNPDSFWPMPVLYTLNQAMNTYKIKIIA